MNTNKIDTDSIIKTLLYEHSWKATGIATLVCLGLLIVLDSALFVLAIEILKALLEVAIIVFAARTAWLVYPILEKKYKDSQKS